MQPPSTDAPATAPIEVKVEAMPSTLTDADRADFRLRYSIKNLGSSTLDPQLGLSELAVDGKRIDDWNFRLGNAGHAKTFLELPAGATHTEEWDVAAYFPAPGTFTVTLTTAGVTSPPIQIVVK